MYRLLVFLVFLAIADCRCYGNTDCRWKKTHNHIHHFCGHQKNNGNNNNSNNGIPENFPGSTFEDIAKSMILIDKALKKFCDENNMNITSEVYGQDNYILKYQLPGFTNSDFEIKVMNRLLYTAAESKDGNVKAFKDLRILPATVDTSQASWVFEHKTLKVYFPYKTKSKYEAALYCNDVDEAVKKVPNMSAGQFGYRSSNF